jgi:hypothetical protein
MKPSAYKSSLKSKSSQPQMTYQLAALALKTSFPEPEFFPEVSGCSQVSLLKSPVPGGSGI